MWRLSVYRSLQQVWNDKTNGQILICTVILFILHQMKRYFAQSDNLATKIFVKCWITWPETVNICTDVLQWVDRCFPYITTFWSCFISYSKDLNSTFLINETSSSHAIDKWNPGPRTPGNVAKELKEHAGFVSCIGFWFMATWPCSGQIIKKKKSQQSTIEDENGTFKQNI